MVLNRLPEPEVPSLELLPLVAIDSIAITMVSYTITISMALIFAQKLNYKIDSNQELLAMVRLINVYLLYLFSIANYFNFRVLVM